MRRTSTLLACSAALAALGSIWAAGCYRLSSDCNVDVTCPSYATTGTGTGGTSTTSSSRASTSASTGTGGTGGTTSTGGAPSSSSAGTTASSSSGGDGCDDGKKNGGETDVDCGGPDCPPCVLGKACAAGGDCVGGECADGVCCDTACTDSCKSCVLPGEVGTCSTVPVGVDDPDTFCFIAATCDVGAMCVGATNKGHFGDACTQDSDCFNGNCRAGACKLQDGDACGEDVVCGSGHCAANVCATCAADTDCATGSCSSGACLLAGGSPCAAPADCANVSCSASGFCVGGSSPCDPATCTTHFCGASGASCQTCAAAADCPLGTPCTGGTCLAPPGAYCNQGSMCASGICAPAAFLSFPKCQ